MSHTQTSVLLPLFSLLSLLFNTYSPLLCCLSTRTCWKDNGRTLGWCDERALWARKNRHNLDAWPNRAWPCGCVYFANSLINVTGDMGYPWYSTVLTCTQRVCRHGYPGVPIPMLHLNPGMCVPVLHLTETFKGSRKNGLWHKCRIRIDCLGIFWAYFLSFMLFLANI